MKQSDVDPWRKRLEGPAKLIPQTGSLQKDALEFVEDWRVSINLIEGGPASCGSAEYPRSGQFLQLTG
jgi:hypothetical protein